MRARNSFTPACRVLALLDGHRFAPARVSYHVIHIKPVVSPYFGCVVADAFVILNLLPQYNVTPVTRRPNWAPDYGANIANFLTP